MLDTLAYEAGFFWRVVVGALLGALVGFERAAAGKPAGVRTHLAVSLGAALMSAAGANGSDTTRIAAQVITGIGFLGAGMLLRDQRTVRGLTSAASLWAVAGIGIAAGLGWFWLSLASTLLLILALGPFDRIEHLLVPRGTSRWHLTLTLPASADAAALPVWRQHNLRPLLRAITADDTGQHAVIEVHAPASLNPYRVIAACHAAGATQVEWEAFGTVARDDEE